MVRQAQDSQCTLGLPTTAVMLMKPSALNPGGHKCLSGVAVITAKSSKHIVAELLNPILQGFTELSARGKNEAQEATYRVL